MKTPIHSTPSPSALLRAERRLTPALAFCGAVALVLAGCASEPDSHLVSAPPPAAPTRAVTTTTVMTTPAASPAVYATPAGYVAAANPAPAVSTIVVTQAPPALEQEVVLAQPSPQHVWIAGYWTWRDNKYEWMAGHWELPPSANAVWMTPRWEQQGNAYRFYEGYWN